MSRLLLVAVLLGPVGSVQGQTETPTEGRIEGRVVVAGTDEPIVDAVVRIEALDRSSTTDAAGNFTITGLPEGHWMLSGRADGFVPSRVRVLVPADGAVRVDLELARRTPTSRVIGRVVERGTTQGVPGASVRIDGGPSTETDDAGRFELVTAAAGPTSVRVWAYGYDVEIVTVEASNAARPVELRLRPKLVGLTPLRVRSTAATEGVDAERELYDLEPRPGVIGMARSEIRDVPPMLEADVLRSLQALPGVVQINDLSARLHVRGGGPDQNLYLLDGARVFAPYHMFGMFGAFNTDAVSRVDFFRGDLPARHGGALSSVVDIEQLDRTAHTVEGDATLGVLSNSGSLRGVLPLVQGRWMAAGRVSTIGSVLGQASAFEGQDFPFSFDDAQARLSISPGPAHRVTGSWFGSNDRFRMFLEGQDDATRSTWSNRVGSLRWLWDPRPGWSTELTGWSSGYGMTLAVGVGDSVPTTRNEVQVRGVRLEVIRRGVTGVRVGAEIRSGRADLDGGDRRGGYVEGAYRQPHDWVSGYAELERNIGPLRLAPGVRVEGSPHRDRLYLAPRVSARLHLFDELALTVGLSRSYQALSTLRDDRYVLPGPPFWFAHASDAPVSRADGVSAALEGWWNEFWSLSFSAFGRRFDDLPVWRPAGDRTLDEIRWDDGTATGLEAVVRRHGETLHGWLSYGYSCTRMVEPDGDEYFPVWDRSHAVDAAVFATIGSLTLGSRAVYGTGTPFWGQAGTEAARYLAPSSGKVEFRDRFPVWGAEQLRYPAYFRLDAVARYAFRWGRLDIEPFAGLLNLTARPNVLYYEYAVTNVGQPGQAVEPDARLEPQTAFPALPSLGVDIHF